MKEFTDLEQMKHLLKEGKVYRRADFSSNTTNVDRYLSRLVHEGNLVKLQHGLYFSPKKTPFGNALPEENDLLKKFLNDDHFVVYNLSMFNSLRLGTTQLYDKKVVFNRKRHGEFELGQRRYNFYRWREAPKNLSKEFLLVEMFNRMDELSENQNNVLDRFKEKLTDFNLSKLYNALNRFGTKSTQLKLKPFLKRE